MLTGASMHGDITTAPLAAHRDRLPLLQAWFEAEWPQWYGAGGRGDARADLEAFAGRCELPIGIVALRGAELVGIAALKAESIASHRHLRPWAAAGLVTPSSRRQGVGALLLAALEDEAARLGFRRIYCGTSRAESLLLRCGWQLQQRITHDGESLGSYAEDVTALGRATSA
jgi:GNAT superfamily N-acetyltransferase